MLLLAEAGIITPIVSKPILDELSTVLGYEKLQAKIRHLQTTPYELMQLVHRLAVSRPIVEVDVHGLRDPKDLMILATAASGDIEVIVTGDLDLLVLGEFAGIPILSPQVFLKQYFPMRPDLIP